MSFKTNKRARESGAQTAWNAQPATQSVSVPAFKPQIVRSVRMYPRLAVCVAAVMFLGLVGFAVMQKSVYLASSQVYVEPIPPKVLSDSAPVFDANKYENFLGEQTQLMQRPDVISAALASLPAAAYKEFGASPAQAADAIQTQMKVARVGTSYQVSIGLKGTDAQKTADIVNAITAAYVATVRKSSAEEYDQRAQLLGEERQRIETELQAARSEQTSLGASIGVANPTGESGNPYDAELNGIRSQLTQARAAHDVAAAQLSSLSGVSGAQTDGLTAAADELIAGDAGLGSMKATISQRKAQLNEQMSGMTASNPIYKQDQSEIADLDRTLERLTNDLRDKAARRLQDKLRADLQRTGDIESRLNGQLARQIATATSAAPRLQRAAEVAEDIKRLDTRMAAIDDALRSLRMEVSGPSQVRLSMPATAPEHPEVNRKKLLLMLALPLALLFGATAAILARKRDQHIYAGIDMEEVLGFPPLAVLPARADVSSGVFGEYVLRLAAGIESAYRTSGARTFLLTAVSMTTDIEPLATALARKFEEIGVNIIVATASDMLSPTGTDGQAETVEVWSEGFVAANVAKMKAEHGLVLIHSEAILNCAQTEYVARCADATILMVECGVTTRQELYLAGELLHRLNVTGIGAVLEEVQLRFADVAFRKAIESLDRRQSASPQPERRPATPRAVIVDLAEQPKVQTVQRVEPPVEIHPDTSTEPKLEAQPDRLPEAQPEPLVAVMPEVQPVELVSMAPVQALEEEADRVELQYEASHYDEVLHHVRASMPTELDEGWQLPAFRQVAAEQESVTPKLPEPVLPVRTVEIVSHTTIKEPESSTTEPMIESLKPSLREKMTPRLSGRRQVPESDGDASMARKASWLDKLLRRDSNAAVSIIPDDSDSDSSPESVQDYEIPLANRLAQISGIRPVAPAAESSSQVPHKSNLVEISHPHPAAVPPPFEEMVAAEVESHPIVQPAAELTSVCESGPAEEAVIPVASMSEPESILHAPVVTEPAPVAIEHAQVEAASSRVVSEPIPVAEVEVLAVPVAKKLSPSAWATADVEPVELVEELPDGSRRPYTFRELMERAQQGESAVTESVPVEVAPVEVVAHVAEPLHDAALHVPGQVTEFATDTSLVKPTEVAHPELVPSEVEAAIASAVAPVVEPEPPVVPKVVEQELPPPESRPEPPIVWARDPEYKFSDAPKPFLNPYDEATPAPEPSTPEAAEVDDVETVYQAASRRLNSGRWDAIPPLRPSMAGWRDRPSPAPFTRDSGGYRADPGVKDAFNAFPPQRWIPEEDVFVSTEPEALPEPALTRQWGLLSKFQQSRLVSSGSVKISEAGKEKGREERDTNELGSLHGNRKS